MTTTTTIATFMVGTREKITVVKQTGHDGYRVLWSRQGETGKWRSINRSPFFDTADPDAARRVAEEWAEEANGKEGAPVGGRRGLSQDLQISLIMAEQIVAKERQIEALTAERDALRAQLAALTSPDAIKRSPEETEALLAEVRRNREERMHGRSNATDSVKAVRKMRGR